MTVSAAGILAEGNDPSSHWTVTGVSPHTSASDEWLFIASIHGALYGTRIKTLRPPIISLFPPI